VSQKLATKGAEVMTPTSLRWGEFTDALSKAMDWKVTDGEPTWLCDGDGGWRSPARLRPYVHRYAKKVMAEMGGIDIPASLEFFKAHGGYCDCEILFNVDRYTDEEAKRIVEEWSAIHQKAELAAAQGRDYREAFIEIEREMFGGPRPTTTIEDEKQEVQS
jgi:hypothetical protein